MSQAEEATEPKLLDTLGIDEELWRSATPRKDNTKQPTRQQPPTPVPASYFQSLRHHTPTHSRNSSMTTPYELISSPVGLRPDESFVSLQSGKSDNANGKVEVSNRVRYSVYVSNDDFEIPEQYAVRSSNWKNKLKGHGRGGSISSLFKRKKEDDQKQSMGHKKSASQV